MRRGVLDADVASLIIRQRLPVPLLGEIVAAHARIALVTLGQLRQNAT